MSYVITERKIVNMTENNMRVVTAGGVRQVGRGNIDGLCNVICKSQATPAQTMNDILQVLVWEQCHSQVPYKTSYILG